MVKGRLNADPETGAPRIWERKDGSPGASYEVTAREIIFLTGRDAGESQESSPASTPTPRNDEMPF